MTARSPESFLATIRTRLAARAAQRHDRMALKRDLAQFWSDGDRVELNMILARNPSDEADEVRRVHARVLATSAGPLR